jgi:hypothetical protein
VAQTPVMKLTFGNQVHEFYSTDGGIDWYSATVPGFLRQYCDSKRWSAFGADGRRIQVVVGYQLRTRPTPEEALEDAFIHAAKVVGRPIPSSLSPHS